MSKKSRFEGGFGSVRPIVSLSLFYVLFLSAETLSGKRAAAFLPPDAVAYGESLAAATSLAGFLLYALARAHVPQVDPLLRASGALGAVGLLVTSLAPGAALLFVSGLTTMLLIGFGGASAHEALARRFADGLGIARVIGFAYAAGIVAQSLLREVAPNPLALALLLAAPAALMPLMAAKSLAEDGVGLEEPPALGAGRPPRSIALLAVLTALITCVFSTFDVNLASAHASGLVDLGVWTGLFLAISALAAGEVMDRLDHRWEPGLMAVVTTLTSFAVFAVLQGAPWGLASIVFYLGSGFFLVFYTSAFMLVARESGRYALWSGMGHVLNSACSLAVAAPALALVSEQRALTETAVILAILAAMLAVTFLVILGPSPQPALPQFDEKDMPGPAALAPTSDGRLVAFAAEFALTEREAEVLQAMVTSHQSVQDLARTLCLSRTAFYRHVASMNAKTGTANRVELMHFFFDWVPGPQDGTSDQR